MTIANELTRVDPSSSQLEPDAQSRPIPPEPSAGYMIMRAMEMMRVPGSGITIDVVERLVALKEREDAKKAERLLDAALLAVKTGCPQILKTREVYGKDTDQAGNRRDKPMMYRYANIEDVKAIVDPRLAANDLSYTWDVEGQPGAMFTVCTVRHTGGGKRSARFPWAGAKAPTMNEAQAAGSSASYGQRYSLLAVLGLSADLDDDGRCANAGAKPEADPNAPVVPTRDERRAAQQAAAQSTSAPPASRPNSKIAELTALRGQWQKWSEQPTRPSDPAGGRAWDVEQTRLWRAFARQACGCGCEGQADDAMDKVSHFTPQRVAWIRKAME
jgi:hypothetical protein